MVLLGWLLGALALLALGSTLALWSYGRFARRARGAPSRVIPPGVDGALDRLLAPLEAAHRQESGAALVVDPLQAFAARLALAQMARRSLDLLYYIWSDDRTGRLMARALLQAADRGVRVRLLLDDVNVLGRDPLYLALDRHPNIAVRLFNPIRARDNAFRRGIDLLFNILRYNRRMHGKIWLADGRLALVGGRNVGDVDFGAATGRKRNNDDCDLIIAGPVLRAVERSFDAHWNNGLALPIAALWQKRRTSMPTFRQRLESVSRAPATRAYLARMAHLAEDADSFSFGARALRLEALRWSDRIEFIADPPEKALDSGRAAWLPEALMPRLLDAQHRLRIMTPYFVPGQEGLQALTDMARRGVRVEIVTNALAVNDHIIVHGAYRWYRRALVEAGVVLHEFAARSSARPGDRQARQMLHGKTFIADDRLGFVGSFNFDMRSVFLNTEMGVLFEDPALLADLGAHIDWAMAPDQAYRLSMDGQLMGWARDAHDLVHLEPDSGVARRMLSFVIGHLPVHRLL
ncbi:MAG: phospholipase D-like domain-containing protein [Pararhodobacter sp.]